MILFFKWCSGLCILGLLSSWWFLFLIVDEMGKRRSRLLEIQSFASIYSHTSDSLSFYSLLNFFFFLFCVNVRVRR